MSSNLENRTFLLLAPAFSDGANCRFATHKSVMNMTDSGRDINADQVRRVALRQIDGDS